MPPTKKSRGKLLRLSSDEKSRLAQIEEDIAVLDMRDQLPSTRAVSELLLTIGGLSNPDSSSNRPLLTAAAAATQLTASIDKDPRYEAQPMPSQIRVMLQLAEYFYRTEGDVAGTVDVPLEIIGKPIEIESDDEGAKRAWNELWRQSDENGMPTLDIDELNTTTYLDIEISGISYPLEVWDNNELSGIAMVEPESMWVGRSLVLETPTDANFPQEKFSAQQRDLIYQSFVTDENQQRLPGYRVNIRYDRMLPIHGMLRATRRYPFPHFNRAARNIMFRQILDEYRRGTIEQYLAQLWMFVLGDQTNPATAVSSAQLNAFNKHLRSAVANHTGFVSTRFPVEAKSLAPEVLDNLMGNESYDTLSTLIMRDLGFNIYLLSGEVPDASSRGGGQQVEVSMQLAIERWKYRTQRFVKWCEYLSKKYAKMQNSPALLKHPAKFIPGSIGIEQYAAIKERIMPLFMAGILDRANALKVGGFSYEGVLANKQNEKQHDELFQPPATYNQTWQGPGGGGSSQTAPQGTGRPPSTGAEKPNPESVKASVEEFEVYGRGEDFREAIDANLEQPNFFDWMRKQIPDEMLRAFQDGFIQFGGLGEPDYAVLRTAPQGIAFQQGRLDMFAGEVKTPQDLIMLRPRALQYAGAVNYAYLLGAQQAMKSHGATEWQRVLHPELSLSGPCAACKADSIIIHSIDEPFMLFHPSDVCSAQAVRYSFAGRVGATIRVPDFIRKVVRRLAR